MWIGKELVELLSNIYIYIPVIVTWVIVIIRNNTIKSGLLILFTLTCLSFIAFYSLYPLEALFSLHRDMPSSRLVVVAISIISFSALLFRSRSFLLTLLSILILLAFILPTHFIRHTFGLAVGLLEALILYAIYLIISKKFSLNKNTWITQQYTHSGYAIIDISILSNVLVITEFVVLFMLLYRLFQH